MRREDWVRIGLAGRALLALVAIHGATSHRWRRVHTAGTALSLIATIGPLFFEER